MSGAVYLAVHVIPRDAYALRIALPRDMMWQGYSCADCTWNEDFLEVCYSGYSCGSALFPANLVPQSREMTHFARIHDAIRIQSVFERLHHLDGPIPKLFAQVHLRHQRPWSSSSCMSSVVSSETYLFADTDTVLAGTCALQGDSPLDHLFVSGSLRGTTLYK